MQINLQSSSLNKIKQILYGRTSRNLENSDWHSQSPKGEFNLTWSISPKINGPHYFLGKGPYLLELVLHGTHLGTHRSGVILCDALLKESCEYSVQLDKCFSFLSLFWDSRSTLFTCWFCRCSTLEAFWYENWKWGRRGSDGGLNMSSYTRLCVKASTSSHHHQK